MHAYVLRRLLIMVPTLVGITAIIWLVMVLSPGRPGEKRGGGFRGMDTSQMDPAKQAEMNESQRLFRRHFGLDRPLFYNDWTTLDARTVEPLVRDESASIEEVGAERKRRARERLEDYGYFAVPALVELLGTTEGRLQDRVLYWVRLSSYRSPVKPYGESLDEETLERNRTWRMENLRLKELAWPPGAPAAERGAVVDAWRQWYGENRARWDRSFGQRLWIGLSDTQFGHFWGNLLKGNLGVSHIHKKPVGDLILERLRYTLSLNLVALLLVYVLAVPLGVFSAVRQDTFADRTLTVILFMLYSLPSFFVGTLLLRWFTTGNPLAIFPMRGFESEAARGMNVMEHFKDVLWHITLPLVTLTYGGLAAISRYARTGMLDVIRSDYVRTARAKGLSEWRVISKHVVRNGIIPIITLLGTTLPVLISGSIIVEYIFNVNGMGLLMIDSINQRDYNVVVGVEFIVAILTMIGILLSDIAYAILDPRISLS